jgi:hypothetical protein
MKVLSENAQRPGGRTLQELLVLHDYARPMAAQTAGSPGAGAAGNRRREIVFIQRRIRIFMIFYHFPVIGNSRLPGQPNGSAIL